LIAVVVQDNVFHLYVNKQLIADVTDKQSPVNHGTISLMANATDTSTKVLYSDMKLWTPSSS
jgi:hypothetical protein